MNKNKGDIRGDGTYMVKYFEENSNIMNQNESMRRIARDF